MPHPLDWLDDELQRLDHAGLRRRQFTHTGAQGPTIDVPEIDSAKAQTLVNFGANDYLGLACDPRLIAAARDAMQSEGYGAGASPLVTGHSNSHMQLEQALAEFEQVEAVLLFSSGYAANTGTIAALVERGDAIFADAKNHASLIDGCRLSRADVHIYRHLDSAHLEELLNQHRSYRRRLIVTDSLFSMDGDIAPLDKIAELAAQHNCMLLVDEAHATGVFGPHGRGLCEQFGVCESQQDGAHSAGLIRVGTLSKALGCAGGFVVGSRALIDWLYNRARSYVFSTAHPAANAAAALAALQIVQSEPQRRTRLLQNAESLRQRLNDAGWNTGHSQSQIIPILIGDPARTMDLASKLRSAGFFVPGIRPPSVPEGESLLRISLSSAHTEEMLERLLVTLQKSRAERLVS
ncbi:MAG: 8-amino-7-oxononanoate synthase [Planctomycetota bacterium]|nr:8-amino-7-oxononanoate synthase [Planctomycetota bacterium]